MKKLMMLLVLGSLAFAGCQQPSSDDTTTGTGAISFHSGEVSGTVTSEINRKISFINTRVRGAHEACIYIKKIEISMTGAEWIEIISSTDSIETRVKNDETIRICASTDVPVGEYHGIRITYDLKARFIFTSSETVVNNPPLEMSVSIAPDFWHVITVGDTMVLSSANGYLTPFTIESGAETFIILHCFLELSDSMYGYTGPITWTRFGTAVRATRFLY